MIQTQIIEHKLVSMFDKMLNDFLKKLDAKGFVVVSMHYQLSIVPIYRWVIFPIGSANLRSIIISFKKLEITPEMLGEKSIFTQ